MGKADKKQRHRAKREAKRRDTRRRESISPLKRLADAPGEAECWMSENFESIHQAQIFAYKRGAGLTGVACFLIDRGVVGLKDAWHRIGLERSEFEGMIDTANRRNLPMKRVTLDEARRMIASGARWAHDNGMRLPKEWLKTATLIGGVGDWLSADVSGFLMEFAGHPEDLRQRLIGEPFDTYLDRTDVRFVFSTDAPFMDQKTGEYSDWNDVEEEDDGETDDEEFDETLTLEERGLPEREINLMARRLAPAATQLAVETAAWLKARNELPSLELFEAWITVTLAQFLSKAGAPDASETEAVDLGLDLLRDLARRLEIARRAELRAAIKQVLQRLLEDPHLMQNAVLKYGLANDDEEQANL